MSDHGFLFQAFVYLAAAVITVPIAKRLGLGSVLGYLLAGVAIGPFGFGFIGSEGQDILHFAEFGVVMMLFLVGLELELTKLWSLRAILLGMGGLQVIGTSIAVTGAAVAIGVEWRAAIAIGLTLSLSSTAIVLQSLQEREQLRTEAGERSFAVLLFQDIAVIPILAIIPLLAPDSVAVDSEPSGWIASIPALGRTFVTLGAVVAVVVGGRYLMRPAFRVIARTRLREMFTAGALLLVIGIALLMQSVGLSPALGTFLAGVVLADSEFRHELVGDVEPFKGLLLGLFFIAVGASVNFQLISDNFTTVAALVLGLVIVKAMVLAIVARLFSMHRDQGLFFTLALAQGGEFCFVVLSYAAAQRVLDPTTSAMLVAVVALSMIATPLLLVLNDRVFQPLLTRHENVVVPEADRVDRQSSVIIAGFGQFGSTVGRLLRANGIRPVVLEVDGDRVELLRRLGLEVYYGDATRLDLLHAAGAEEAAVMVIAVGDGQKGVELAQIARHHFPNLKVLARASERRDAFNLLEAGAHEVYRDTLDTSLRVGIDALRATGMRAHRAHRSAQAFRRHDERSIRDLAAEGRVDQRIYLRRLREKYRDLEQILLADNEHSASIVTDDAWDAESLIREYGSKPLIVTDSEVAS